MKMTITDQIKILNRNIMQNEAQYNLDGKAADLSSSNVDKCEYMTSEDLDLKPSIVEHPLGKIFNKELDKNDQNEGLFKKLKEIENAQKGLINGDNRNKDQKRLINGNNKSKDQKCFINGNNKDEN